MLRQKDDRREREARAQMLLAASIKPLLSGHPRPIRN
jgi:hypothetical protein